MVRRRERQPSNRPERPQRPRGNGGQLGYPQHPDPEPGDLLFFGSSPRLITHVTLYTGGGNAIDAPHSGAVVRQAPAHTTTPTFQGATRPAAQAGGGR
ncbi:NlpC/P60 family protein [Streptomyces kronopolitis]